MKKWEAGNLLLKFPKITFIIKTSQSILFQYTKNANYTKGLTPSFTDCAKLQPVLRKFHWRFWIFLDALTKAKKTNLQIYSTESQASFTDKEVI